MYKAIITPRFCDTDALGHINNNNAPVWFEGARDSIIYSGLRSPEMAVDYCQNRGFISWTTILWARNRSTKLH